MFLRRLIQLCAIILFLFFPQSIYAQIIPTQDITPTPIVSKDIDYPLPYPGIFPGKPFYFFKNLRDKFLEIATLNPLKKTELYLLQADKKLSFSLYFYNSHNEENAEKMMSSGLDYLDKAINEENHAKNTPGNLLELSQKIQQSSKKQTEIAQTFYTNSDGEVKGKFKIDFERAQDLKKRASQFDL